MSCSSVALPEAPCAPLPSPPPQDLPRWVLQPGCQMGTELGGLRPAKRCLGRTKAPQVWEHLRGRTGFE